MTFPRNGLSESRPKRACGSQRGSVMVPLLIISGVVVVVTYLISNMLISLLKVNSFFNLQVTAALIKERVTNTMQNDTSWAQTVHASVNSSLSCLRANGQICSSVGGAFSLFDSDGTIAKGFNENGESCTSNCLFEYTFRWRPNCPASCASEMVPGDTVAFKPYVLVDAILTVNETVLQTLSNYKELPRLDAAKYSFNSFERGRNNDTVSGVCRSLGGRFDQVTETCQLGPSLMLGPCGSGEVMKGIDANGNRICEPMPSLGKECPNSSAVLGVTQGGDLLCGKF